MSKQKIRPAGNPEEILKSAKKMTNKKYLKYTGLAEKKLKDRFKMYQPLGSPKKKEEAPV